MAIYKQLGEITKVRTGTTPRTNDETLWKEELPWFTVPDLVNNKQATKMISYSFRKEYVPAGSVLLSTTATIGEVVIASNECWHSQQISSFENDQKVILNKYLYFKLKSSKDYIKSFASGSAFGSINKTLVEKIKILIPSIEEQKQIIDIIEPKEELFIKYSNTIRIDTFKHCEKDLSEIIDIIEPLENINSMLTETLNTIKELEKRLIIFNEKTNYNFKYEKGSLPSKDIDSELPEVCFLNVAAANGNPNRMVREIPNTKIGDVTLSLDGNCGLVNNCLEGYNGYLYKVYLDNEPNWKIYYSLLTSESQDIIKINETGTTIKHSPNSKTKLTLFNFKHEEMLEKLFHLSINLKLIQTEVSNLIENTVLILIK